MRSTDNLATRRPATRAVRGRCPERCSSVRPMLLKSAQRELGVDVASFTSYMECPVENPNFARAPCEYLGIHPRSIKGTLCVLIGATEPALSEPRGGRPRGALHQDHNHAGTCTRIPRQAMIVKLPLGVPECLCILACEQIKPAFWHSFNEKALSSKLAKMCGIMRRVTTWHTTFCCTPPKLRLGAVSRVPEDIRWNATRS